MNMIDAFWALFRLPLATWNCVVAFERGLPDGLACSLSFNSVLLAAVLLAALWLVGPFDLQERDGGRGGRTNRSGRGGA